MSGVSKGVADRLVISRAVLRVIRTRGAAVVAGLTGELGGSAADYEALLDRLHARLNAAHAGLHEADVAHGAELADDPSARDTRDEAERALRDLLLIVKDTVGRAYGMSQLGAVGLDEALPTSPQHLAQLGRKSARLLAEADLGAPASSRIHLDAAGLAEDIAAAATALEATLDAVEEERREAQQTLTGKERAIETWGRVYRGVAESVHALALLANEPEVASVVRPTSRRSEGRPEPADLELASETLAETETSEPSGESDPGAS